MSIINFETIVKTNDVVASAFSLSHTGTSCAACAACAAGGIKGEIIHKVRRDGMVRVSRGKRRLFSVSPRIHNLLPVVYCVCGGGLSLSNTGVETERINTHSRPGFPADPAAASPSPADPSAGAASPSPADPAAAAAGVFGGVAGVQKKKKKASGVGEQICQTRG